MAIQFITAVNDTLKRVGAIQGDSGELATSTTTTTATGAIDIGDFERAAIQTQIDRTLQVWREMAHEIFSHGLHALEAASATFVTVAAQREYNLPSDFERIAGKSRRERVLRGATTGLVLFEYPGGYARMLADQPVATDWTGDPQSWAISPANDTIRLGREPTTDTASDTYNMLYEKRIALTATMATDTMPFSDTVTENLVAVAAEVWNRIGKQEFDRGLFISSITRAMAQTTRTQPRAKYGRPARATRVAW